jgi:Flp pilus assembly pilin Flp
MQLKRNEKGQSVAEYVLILAAIVVLAVLLINKMQQPLTTKINSIGTQLNQ